MNLFTIKNILQVAAPNCDSIKSYTISVSYQQKLVFTLSSNVGNFTVPDLDGYTNYTIKVQVINSADLGAESATVRTTRQLRKSLVLSLVECTYSVGVNLWLKRQDIKQKHIFYRKIIMSFIGSCLHDFRI